MKNLTNIIIGVLLAGFTASCGGNGPDTSTPEGKRKAIQQYEAEIREIQAKADKLKEELEAEMDIDPMEKLRKVVTVNLTPDMFEHFVEVQGNVSTDKNVMINPEASGVLLKRRVQEGQRVSKGQVLAEIDAEMIRRNIEELKTKLDLAATLYKKQSALWEQKIGTEIQYLQAKNNKESLERSLASLNSQLGKTLIKSPINGVVDEFFINEGEMANLAAPAVRVVNLSKVKILTEVSEAYIKDVKKGDEVEVIFPLADLSMNTNVNVVGNYINPNNRTFRVEMKVDNAEGLLKPNTMAVVRFKDFEAADAISAPANLIQKSTKGDKFVYTVTNDGGKAIVKKVTVETGMTYNGNTMITKGLKSGDKVITKGYNEVVHGEEVRIVKG